LAFDLEDLPFEIADDDAAAWRDQVEVMSRCGGGHGMQEPISTSGTSLREVLVVATPPSDMRRFWAAALPYA
jgi:hypothetical protein